MRSDRHEFGAAMGGCDDQQLGLGEEAEPLLEPALGMRLACAATVAFAARGAARPGAIARWVLPTPGGPNTSRASPCATQRQAASSWTCRAIIGSPVQTAGHAASRAGKSVMRDARSRIAVVSRTEIVATSSTSAERKPHGMCTYMRWCGKRFVWPPCWRHRRSPLLSMRRSRAAATRCRGSTMRCSAR